MTSNVEHSDSHFIMNTVSLPSHLVDSLMPISIGISGHRDIHPDDLEHAKISLREIFLQLAERYTHSPLRLLSPLAEGADRHAAEQFLQVKAERIAQGDAIAPHWELIVPLPLSESLYRADFDASDTSFDALKSQATQVIELPLANGATIAQVSELGEARDQQYEAAGIYVARHSNLLIALWDGQPHGLRAGTSRIVEYKLHGTVDGLIGRDIYDQDVGPVYHIQVRRSCRSDAGKRQDGAQGCGLRYRELLPDETIWPRGTLAESLFAFERYNQALLQENIMPEEINLSLGYLLEESPERRQFEKELTPCESRTLSIYAGLDALAIKIDKQRLKYHKAMFVAAGGAAICLLTALEDIARIPLFIGYVACMSVVAMLFSRLRAPRISYDQLGYRAFAEILRVQINWTAGCLPNGVTASSLQTGLERVTVPHVMDGILRQHLNEVGWIKEGLRACGLLQERQAHVSRGQAHFLAKQWIDGQLRFFERTESRYQALARRIDRISAGLSITGVLFVIGVLVLDRLKANQGDFHHFVMIAASLAPALTLLLQSYSDRLAVAEQEKNMARMRLVFERARRVLLRDELSDSLINNELMKVGHEAIAEAINWLILKRSKPETMPH
jgi:hypothetical protein